MSYFGLPIRNGVGIGISQLIAIGGANLLYRLAPSLLLQFAGAETLDPRITFTRASSATRTNAAGLIELVGSNQPRFDYDPVTGACKGLLIEEQRTNLLTYSEQFDNAVWTKTNATVTANATTAPDGTTTADALIATGSVGRAAVTVTIGSGTTVVASFFVKPFTSNWFRIRLEGSTDVKSAWLNVATGTVGTVSSAGTYITSLSASVAPAANGFYRCVLTIGTSGITSLVVGASMSATDNSSAAASDSIYIWGAQLEAGSFPTSYIPTTTAAATRAVDIATMTGTNFSSWYRQDEGTLFVDADSTNFTAATFPAMASANDGTTNNSFLFGFLTSGVGGYEVKTAGVNQVAVYPGVNTPIRKAAFAYKANDFAVSYNGATVSTDTSGTVPTVSVLNLGVSGTAVTSTSALDGHIRRIAYYPRRLTNSELQAITS